MVRDKNRYRKGDRNNDGRADVEPDWLADRSVLTLQFVYVIIQFLVAMECKEAKMEKRCHIIAEVTGSSPVPPIFYEIVFDF